MLVILLIIIIIIDNSHFAIAKNDDDIETRYKKLIEMNSEESVIRLDNLEYEELVKKSPRNYSVIIMMTGLGKSRQCDICQEAFKEYLNLANSWLMTNNEEKNLFFALIDVDVGNTVNIFVSLKIGQIPVMIHFPRKGNPKFKEDSFFFKSEDSLKAEKMGKWVSTRTGNNVKIIVPIEYRKFIGFIGSILFVVAILVLKPKLILNTSVCSFVVNSIIILFSSGLMWDHIYKPPFSTRNHKTNAEEFMVNDPQYQLGAETYSLFIIYSVISFGFIFLNQAYKLNRTWKKLIIMIIGIIIVAFSFSILLLLIDVKFRNSGGYPYGISGLMTIKLV
jgi:hypothetical protein